MDDLFLHAPWIAKAEASEPQSIFRLYDSLRALAKVLNCKVWQASILGIVVKSSGKYLVFAYLNPEGIVRPCKNTLFVGSMMILHKVLQQEPT